MGSYVALPNIRASHLGPERRAADNLLQMQITVDLPAKVSIVSKLYHYSSLPLVVIKGEAYPLAAANNVQPESDPLV